MADRPTGTVVVRRRADGTSEVSLADAASGRESRTGMTGRNDQETRELAGKLAEIVKKSGSGVNYREV